MFCLVFLGGSVKTILRVKRSSEVILAIFGHFCKIKKARHLVGGYRWCLNSSINLGKNGPMAPDAKKLFKILVSR